MWLHDYEEYDVPNMPSFLFFTIYFLLSAFPLFVCCVQARQVITPSSYLERRSGVVLCTHFP